MHIVPTIWPSLAPNSQLSGEKWGPGGRMQVPAGAWGGGIAIQNFAIKKKAKLCERYGRTHFWVLHVLTVCCICFSPKRIKTRKKKKEFVVPFGQRKSGSRSPPPPMPCLTQAPLQLMSYFPCTSRTPATKGAGRPYLELTRSPQFCQPVVILRDLGLVERMRT